MNKPENRKHTSNHTARQRAQAVLSIWTEKRRAREVIKEMSISWTILGHWQSKAMVGMLKALEPRKMDQEQGPALAPRLEKLLARKAAQGLKLNKLEMRLEKIQQAKSPSAK